MLHFPEPYSAPPPAKERAGWISSYAGENVSINVLKTGNNLFWRKNMTRVFACWEVLAAKLGCLFAFVDTQLVLLHIWLVRLAPVVDI